MKQHLAHLAHLPCYPFLFSLYPILALLAVNESEVVWTAALRSLVVSVLMTGVLFCLLRWMLHLDHRTAFALLLFEVIFFAYGHAYSFLRGEHVANLNLTLPLLTIALMTLIFWAITRSLDFSRSALLLNSITLGLVLFAAGQCFINAVRPVGAEMLPEDPTLAENIHIPANQPLPDIYYIVLDSYARADRLQTLYQYDNSRFLQTLRSLGFYVASCSQSNYGRTDLSLASALNMDYIQRLRPELTPETISRSLIFEDLKHSAVRRILEENGYRTIAFATGFAWSEWTDADEFIAPSPLSPNLNEFESLLLRTTLIRQLLESGIIQFDPLGAHNFRERTLLVLETLPELPRAPGPKFVFAHLIIPHPPFVFGPNGEEVDAAQYLNAEGKYTFEKYAEGYTAALTFLNAQLESILARLIAESDTPPIIIVQGDHGPWLQAKERAFDILNAYYLPGHQDVLYPSISPVNSFRVVFNTYFGARFPLLPDYSYASPVPKIYNFTFIPNPCKTKKRP